MPWCHNDYSRNVLGTKSLGDILSERESIAQDMQETLDEATEPWGVKVERVEVKDVRLPQNLQRAMAAEAEAAREARAKGINFLFVFFMALAVQVITAEGEQKASQALRHAAEVIGGSPAALQVGSVHAVCTIMGNSACGLYNHR